MQLNNEQMVLDSHPAAAEEITGDGAKANANTKFKDTQSLQKAYSSLEAEFTKRCQRLKKLEGELEQLKSGKTNDFSNEGEHCHAPDEGDICEVDTPQENNSLVDKQDGDDAFNNDRNRTGGKEPLPVEANQAGDAIAAMVDFFESYPEAAERMDEFMVSLADRKPTTKADFEREYISYLTSSLKKGEQNLVDEEYLYNLLNNSNVKQRFIREYLESLFKAKPSSIIMGGAGQIPTIPPMRPKNITEASVLAKNIIKLR